jgi:hypothetical protein
MFTPKLTLPLATLLCAMTLLGCEKSLDSPEYGELINRVPQDLNRPYPLPELDPPVTVPLPGPSPAADPVEPGPAAQPAETTTEPAPAEAPPGESVPKSAKNPE